MTGPWTIVDVLEGALDGDLSAERAQRLSMSEVRTLREVVLQFYDVWAPRPPEGDGVFRAHLGGWVASTASGGIARELLHAALLYAHEVVVHDPVAAYFEPRRRHLRAFDPVRGQGIDSTASAVHQERTGGYESHAGNLDAHRSNLAQAIPRVAALAPLIREGIVIPIPHLKLTLQREEKIWVAIRHLLNDDSYVALVDQPVDRPALARDDGPGIVFLTRPQTAMDARVQMYGDPAYYLSRSIAMADASYASYLPPSGTEWAIYRQRLARLGTVLANRERVDLTVAPALLQSRLPYFEGLSDADILGARRDDEGFGQWRLRLRAASRQISALPSDGDAFVTEARDVLIENLDEVVAEVRRETSRSAALKRSLKTTALTVSTGAAGLAGSAALGAPPETGAAALGVSGMLRWLADSLLAPNLSGSKAVLAHLVHPHLATEADDQWPKREPLLLTPKQRPRR